VKTLLGQFDLASSAQRFSIDDLLRGGDVLIARSATSGGLVIYDARLRPRVELEVAAEAGFQSRAGQEYPLGGFNVRRVWSATLSVKDG
jgi:hypothetical protein